MIWLAGSVALAIVLAVLQLTPTQLSAISLGVDSERWQQVAYLILVGWLLLWLLPYLYRLVGTMRTARFLFHLIPAFITPTSSSYKKWLSGGYRIGMLAVFWLAVLTNGMAQRMAAIEASVPKVVSVVANVHPLGLSDRRLMFELIATTEEVGSTLPSNPLFSAIPKTSAKLSKQKPKLQQGYRQLVVLTDIQLYTEQNQSALATRAKDSDSKHSTDSKQQDDSKYATTFKSGKQQLQLNPLEADIRKLTARRQAAELADNGKVTPTYQLPTTMTVMLSAYRPQFIALNDFAPNQQLQMQLQLSPIELLEEDSSNEFDEYRWLSSRHATAKAKVLSVDVESQQQRPSSLRLWIDNQRFELRQHFLQLMRQRHLIDETLTRYSADSDDPDSDYSGLSQDQRQIDQQHVSSTDAMAVTLSLLTGDRSLISPQMTDLYRFAGISHLLAISGTHVLFLAMLCAGMVTQLLTRFAPSFYQIVPRWQCAFVISVSAAFGYALFAGFDVPAVRTACMLLVVGVLRYLLASASVFKVLLMLAVAMVWADIFVLWQAGFWLSFIAVAVLVIYSQRWEQGSEQPSMAHKQGVAFMWQRIKHAAFGLFKLQIWMSVALLPISLWLFGQVSLWGFVVNLFAIGLFGWVIVPINLLAGVLYAAFPSYPQWADALWSALFWLLDSLHHALFALQHSWQQAGWLYAKPSLALLLLLFLAVLPWLLPKGLFSRLLSVPPLLVIVVLSVYQLQQRQNMLHIQVLTPVKQDKKAPLAATLIWHRQQVWLLLSAYPKTSAYPKKSVAVNAQAPLYALKAHPNQQPQQPLWTAEQQQQLVQSLYDQIKQQHLNHLTGVIVQTATPQMASVVAQLAQLLPTSYYWQAGLASNQQDVALQMAETGTALTAQSCHVGLRWQANESLQLSAETGWDTVASADVWDCAIGLRTSAAVALPNGVNLPDKPSNQEAHQFLFYSSNQPQLGRLWQLMCAANETEGIHLASPTSLSARKNSAPNLDTVTQSHTLVNKAARRHWLISSKASIDRELVSSRQPLTWYILDEQQSPATLKLKETQLYWQQQNADFLSD